MGSMKIAPQASMFRPLPRSAGGAGGFSLLELLMVLVIMGTLAMVAGPRMFSVTGYQARGFHDELISAVRYAQKLAVAGGCRVEVSVSGNAYALRQGNPGCDDPLSLPVAHPATRDSFAGSAPAGISVSSNAGLVFTALGSVEGGGPVTMTISGGGNTRTITVHGDTGYVQGQQ